MDAPENRLITIPMSHYCEKARWALELASVPYAEVKHLQGFHYLYSFRFAHSPTVPVLITKDAVLSDSTDIMKWVDQRMPDRQRLYPGDKKIEEFEDYLDEAFGPAGRLWMYSYMLSNVDVLYKYAKIQGIPNYEIRLMGVAFPMFRPLIHRRLKMRENSRAAAKKIVDEVFERVAAQLSDKKYLFGESLTAADLTFAALSAPAILPEEYGARLPQLDELAGEMAAQVDRWRQHPAGKFAARIYKEHRGKKS